MKSRADWKHFSPATLVTLWLPGNDVILFVEGRKQDRVEVNDPLVIVDFFETDRLVGHRVGEIEQACTKTKGATGGNFLGQEMTGILERWLTFRIGSQREVDISLPSWCPQSGTYRSARWAEMQLQPLKIGVSAAVRK